MKIVAYYRVSTQRQAHSGLGLAAQREAVERLARERHGRIVAEFTETESGGDNERPQLTKALMRAKVTGAVLAIAKLDRLSRSVGFLGTLQESGTRFVAADMPDATEFTVNIMAAVARQERKAISERTKAALAAKRDFLAANKAALKRAGKPWRLGNPDGAAALLRAGKGNAASLAAIRAGADSRAESLRPVLAELAAEGITTRGPVAAALNERGITTPRGGRWHKSSVRNLFERLGL